LIKEFFCDKNKKCDMVMIRKIIGTD